MSATVMALVMRGRDRAMREWGGVIGVGVDAVAVADVVVGAQDGRRGRERVEWARVGWT